MNGIMAFFSAALPWIVMGVALAIFFARETKRTERRKDRQSDRLLKNKVQTRYKPSTEIKRKPPKPLYKRLRRLGNMV